MELQDNLRCETSLTRAPLVFNTEADILHPLGPWVQLSFSLLSSISMLITTVQYHQWIYRYNECCCATQKMHCRLSSSDIWSHFLYFYWISIVLKHHENVVSKNFSARLSVSKSQIGSIRFDLVRVITVTVRTRWGHKQTTQIQDSLLTHMIQNCDWLVHWYIQYDTFIFQMTQMKKRITWNKPKNVNLGRKYCARVWWFCSL